jgi:hypothetical protein
MVDLLELGDTWFATFRRELAGYGLALDPTTQVRRGSRGMHCYYNLEDRQIYLSVPGTRTASQELQTLLLGSLLSCSDLDELLRFWSLFTPRLIAHEMGHALRHHYGRFGADLWLEEQIANQFASAVTNHRVAPADRRFAVEFLRRATRNLEGRVKAREIAALSYHNVLDGLRVLGHIDAVDQDNVRVLQSLLAMSPEEVLRGSGHLSDRASASLADRDQLIGDINAEYTSNFLQYLYCQVGWTYLDLTSRDRYFVDELARVHLGGGEELLPPVPSEPPADVPVIQALYRAHLDVEPRSTAAARYFYKRYRAALLACLAPLDPSVLPFLTQWHTGQIDGLVHAARLAPPRLRALAPDTIGESLPASLDLDELLPAEVDRRLWRHIARGEDDPGAAHTLRRLSLLEGAEVFRAVPATAILALARAMYRVRFAPGETIVWEGEHDTGVYLVSEGELEVLASDGADERHLSSLGPREVFGEMAFFVRGARNATVRARTAAECFAIKDTDLRITAYAHPSILMHMAGVVTRRLGGGLQGRGKEGFADDGRGSDRHMPTLSLGGMT